jgi:predicted exporter
VTIAGKSAVAIWLATLTLCAAIIARSPIGTDMSAFLPRSPGAAQQVLVDQLREGVVSRLLLVAIEGAPSDTLAALSKAMARQLRGAPDFASVNNGEDADFAGDRDFVWRNRYLLSPGVTPEAFTAAGLRAALESDLQLLGSELGPIVKRSLPADPTGEILKLLDGLAAGAAHPPMREGIWTSADGSRALLMAQTRAAGFDVDGQERAVGEVRQAFAVARSEAKSEAGAAGARLVESGPPLFAVETRATMKGDAERFSIIATALVATLLLLAYRNPAVLILALLPVASGALAGIAAVALGFGFVHGITLGFGVTLIGEAVDYAIYLFTQTAPGSTPEATLPRIWPTLRLGMLTSVCGFSAMLFSSFVGFAQLGLFTVVGLIAALAVTRWVLPRLLPKGFAARGSTVFAAPLLPIVRSAPVLRYVVVALAILAGAALLLHRGPFWEAELESLSPISPAAKALDRKLRGDLGAPDVRYMVAAESSEADGALEASERLTDTLQGLVAPGALEGFDAPDRYLPSQATQRRRQQAIPPPEELAANLVTALAGMPFRSGTFAPFLADAEAARTGPLIERGALAGTGIELKLEALLLPRGEGWIAMLPLRGVAAPDRVAAAIAARHEPGAVFLDLKSESDNLLHAYLHEAQMLSLIGSIVVVLLLAVALRAPARTAALVAPLAAAVIVAAALLLLVQGQLSIFNLFGLLLTVAVGSNYALFFQRREPSEERQARTIASLVLANLCTVIGFGVLSFSGIPVLHGIGSTVAIGAFLSLIFAAILTAGSLVGQDNR